MSSDSKPSKQEAARRRWLGQTLTVAAAAGVPLLMATGPVHAQAIEKKKVTIAVGGKSALYYLSLTIAEQLGYFKDEGLDVEIVDFAGGSKSLQAVVGGSADVVSGAYEHTINLQARKQYFTEFVLMGRLSPLDGIGPREIHFDRLVERVDDGLVKEVILATNFTQEGEATAHYLAEMLRARGLAVSRLARGVPLGGELEYVDAATVAQAMRDRRNL